MNENVFITIFGILCIILGYHLGLLFPYNYNFGSLEKNVGYSNCSSLDLISTSKCLQQELEGIYKYNISNKGKKLELELLKEEGGVCSHFADWYKNQLTSLGASYRDQENLKLTKNNGTLYTTKCLIDVNENKTHIFSIMSSDEGYCILDQLATKCILFE